MMSSPLHHRRSIVFPSPPPLGGGDDVNGSSGHMDLPQGFADEPAHVVARRKRQNSSRNLSYNRGSGNGNSSSKGSLGSFSDNDASSWRWTVTFGLLVAGVLVGGYLLTSRHERAALDQMRRDLERDEEARARDYERRINVLERENKVFRTQITAAGDLKAENERLLEETEHAQALRDDQKSQIDRLTRYKRKMQESIQLMSKTALLEK
jgi:hypothetical protein